MSDTLNNRAPERASKGTTQGATGDGSAINAVLEGDHLRALRDIEVGEPVCYQVGGGTYSDTQQAVPIGSRRTGPTGEQEVYLGCMATGPGLASTPMPPDLLDVIAAHVPDITAMKPHATGASECGVPIEARDAEEAG